MLALVTGCSGFIGRHCARELAARGATVLGIDADMMPEPQAWGITHFCRARISAASLDGAAGRYGVPHRVIHCAGSGSVSLSLDDPYADFQANVQSSLEILEFSRRHRGSIRTAFPSSAAVYGNPSASPIREDADASPVSPYGAHKKMMEDLAASYGKHFGVPSACVRLFSVYGAGLRKQLLWDACRKAGSGDFTFSGAGGEARDWLHAQDAARLLLTAAEHASPAVPVINGGTGRETTVREILEMLGSQWPFSLRPSFTGMARRGDPARLVADTSRLREWGFSAQISLERGVREYAAWFQGESNRD